MLVCVFCRVFREVTCRLDVHRHKRAHKHTHAQAHLRVFTNGDMLFRRFFGGCYIRCRWWRRWCNSTVFYGGAARFNRPMGAKFNGPLWRYHFQPSFGRASFNGQWAAALRRAIHGRAIQPSYGRAIQRLFFFSGRWWGRKPPRRRMHG